jgi:hypothetical protein
MPFNNLLLAVALTVLWPLVLMGLLAAAEWLERRTLPPGEVIPSAPRPATAPEPAEATGAAATPAAPAVPAASWALARGAAPDGTGSGPGGLGDDGPAEAPNGERLARRAFGGGRHLRRAGGGRHERRG